MENSTEIISHGNVLEVYVSGKLQKDFYEEFVPLVEKQISEFGKLRILFQMHEFHGWTAGALWEDLKFDIKHFKDIELLAIVGDSKWEEGMAIFCKPFTTAKVRYFDVADIDEAHLWINES